MFEKVISQGKDICSTRFIVKYHTRYMSNVLHLFLYLMKNKPIPDYTSILIASTKGIYSNIRHLLLCLIDIGVDLVVKIS